MQIGKQTKQIKDHLLQLRKLFSFINYFNFKYTYFLMVTHHLYFSSHLC